MRKPIKMASHIEVYSDNRYKLIQKQMFHSIVFIVQKERGYDNASNDQIV